MATTSSPLETQVFRLEISHLLSHGSNKGEPQRATAWLLLAILTLLLSMVYNPRSKHPSAFACAPRAQAFTSHTAFSGGLITACFLESASGQPGETPDPYILRQFSVKFAITLFWLEALLGSVSHEGDGDKHWGAWRPMCAEAKVILEYWKERSSPPSFFDSWYRRDLLFHSTEEGRSTEGGKEDIRWMAFLTTRRWCPGWQGHSWLLSKPVNHWQVF